MQLKPVLAFVAVSAVLAVAALPALRGAPVYDDQRMEGNRFMDDRGDVAAVFVRNSSDYLASDRHGAAIGVFTYRPLAMLGLVSTEVFGRSSDRTHHLVSFAILLVGLAALAAALSALGIEPLIAAAITGLVGANPAIGETWLFVNGRADLQAFGCVALFAWALASLRRGGSRRAFVPLALVSALGAALSKETSLVALVFVTAVVVGVRGPRPGTRTVILESAFVAIALGFGALLVGRYASAVRAGGVAASSSAIDVASLVASVPRLTALALGSFVSPESRSMRALAYELVRPPGPLEAVGGIAFAGLTALAIVRRSRALGVALVAIPLTLLPCAYVATTFWLGLDRYVALAVLPALLAVPDLVSELSPKVREWATMLAATLFVVSLAGLYGTARSYAGQAEFAERMRASRPLDPSGFVLGAALALERENAPAFDRLAATVPDVTPYPPIAFAWYEVVLAAGKTDLALDGIDRLHAAHPLDPRVAALAVEAALTRGDLERALAAASQAMSDDIACRRVVSTLERIRAIPSLTIPDRRAIAAFIRRAPRRCQ